MSKKEEEYTGKKDVIVSSIINLGQVYFVVMFFALLIYGCSPSLQKAILKEGGLNLQPDYVTASTDDLLNWSQKVIETGKCVELGKTEREDGNNYWGVVMDCE